METMLRFGLFLLSMTGYLLYMTQRYQIRMEFAPALFCAWISNLLFAAGILNILPHAVWLLFAGGFFFLIRSAKSNYVSASHCQLEQHTIDQYKNKNIFSQNRSVLFRYIVFLIVIIYFFQLLYSAHFTSYDNFSHWATVVKDLLLQQRMPNFEDAVIRFQSYPLGSSLFLFYVCSIIGTSDGCMLWAQFLMLGSFLFVLAALIRKKNVCQSFFAALCSIWMLSVNNSIYELRVDTLLPIAGIAAFTILYIEKEQPGKAMYQSMGILMLLVNIKNSGIFFYLACILFFAVYHHKGFWQYKKPFFAAGLIAPLSVIFLWKRHVAFAFSDGMSSKHSMNLAHFGEMAAKKSTEDILEIGMAIIRRFTDFRNVEVTYMLFATALVLILLLSLARSGLWIKMLWLLAGIWSCFIIYTVSLYAMYIFSMPMGESAHLASYDRYILSVLIFLYGIIAVVILDTGNIFSIRCKNIYKLKYLNFNIISCSAILGTILLFAFLLSWQVRKRLELLIQPPDFTHTKRSRMQELIKKNGITEENSVFLYVKGSADDARYFFYLTRFELWTDDVLVVYEENFEQNWQHIQDYDKLVIWESDEHTDWYLKTQGLSQYLGIDQIVITK